MPAVARVVLQLVAETAVALTLAAVLAGAWALVGDVGLVRALSITSYLAAGIWLFAGSSLFPRLTTVEHAPWSERADSGELANDPSVRRPNVSLSPLAASIVVALVLVAFGVALELWA